MTLISKTSYIIYKMSLIHLKCIYIYIYIETLKKEREKIIADYTNHGNGVHRLIIFIYVIYTPLMSLILWTHVTLWTILKMFIS